MRPQLLAPWIALTLLAAAACGDDSGRSGTPPSDVAQPDADQDADLPDRDADSDSDGRDASVPPDDAADSGLDAAGDATSDDAARDAQIDATPDDPATDTPSDDVPVLVDATDATHDDVALDDTTPTDVGHSDTTTSDAGRDIEADTSTPPTCVPGSGGTLELETVPLLDTPGTPADAIANLSADDLLGDGSPQLLISQPWRRTVSWLHGCTSDDPSSCEVTPLDSSLVAPVRARVVDLDLDGDRDVVVADIGRVLPTDLPVGSVSVLWNDRGTLRREVILQDVRRVACAETADFDGDGRLDIVVCEFGNAEGTLTVLDQDENGEFSPRVVYDLPGAIHAWPVDIDRDGDVDIVATISQLTEEIILLRNDGTGAFETETLFAAGDVRFGMSGSQLVDLDQDGDIDIVFTNGDTFDGEDLSDVDPWTFHGVRWLENDGDGRFTTHEIGGLWAAYSTAIADFDLDCDLDIIAVGVQVPEQFPGARQQAIVWFENDGAQRFTRRDLPNPPEALVTATALDFDRDGDPDVVVGVYPADGVTRPESALLLRNRARDPDPSARARLSTGVDTLGETGIFIGPPRDHRLVAGGFVYEVNAPLWTDGATKWRGAVLPLGTRAETGPDGHLVFPDGTVLVKSFGLPTPSGMRWIETRLLVRDRGRWTVSAWRWRADGSDADRFASGASLQIPGLPNRWPMPSETACKTCHGNPEPIPLALHLPQLVGPSLAGVDQLDRLIRGGHLAWIERPDDSARFPDPADPDAPTEARARAWLEGNCAHCHQQGGSATRAGLWLGWDVTDPRTLGICRTPDIGSPVIPGRTHIIVPGHPEESALIARIASTDPLLRMPELGSNAVDREGVALLTAWIESLDGPTCSP